MHPGSPLADSHVHLDRYPAPVVARMLRAARRAGVRSFLTVGVDLPSSELAVRLTRYRGVRAAVGIHPRRVTQAGLADALVRLRRLASHSRVVALGEVGLDDQPGAPPLPVQRRLFEVMLALASELDLALSVHAVGAHDLALELLDRHRPRRAVIHYFQGDLALARAYIERGCWIAVGKPVTRASNPALLEAVSAIPLDRLLLETDTYPLPDRSTQPRDIRLICQAVAGLRGIGPEEVAAATGASFERLFSGPSGQATPRQ